MNTSTQAQAQASSSSSIIEFSKQSGSDGQHGPAKRTRLMRIIGRTLLGVMVLVGLAMVICWVLVIPKTPVLTLESGNVTTISLSDRKLNATIVFTIKSFNPNKRASILVDSMRMIVTDMGQKFSSTIPTFSQSPGNQTVFKPAVQVNFVYPFGRMKDMVQLEGINPELRFSARISYILERWTSKRRSLEVYCNHLRLKINGSTPFDNTKCVVDL